MVAALARFALNKSAVSRGTLDVMESLPAEARDDMRRLLTGFRLSSANFAWASKLGILEFETSYNRQFLIEEYPRLLRAEAHQKSIDGMSVFELTNPAIPSPVLGRWMKAPGTTRFAQIVMSANPKCPKVRETAIASHEMPAFAEALCFHGDLTKIGVKNAIAKHVLGRFSQHAVAALCGRQELPEAFAAALLEKAVGDDYSRLGRTDGYKLFAAKAAVKFDFKKEPVILPPDLSTEQLSDLFSAQMAKRANWPATIGSGMAALATHPNATERLVKAAMALGVVRAHLCAQAISNQSPHAELIIRDLAEEKPPRAMITDLADIQCASPSGLLEAFQFACDAGQGENAMALIAHPKFPMHDVDEKELIASCDNSLRGEMYSAMCLSMPGLNLLDRDTSNFAVPALFSAQTSGVRLEKLAAKHPELVAMAACHPNGVDIDVSDSDRAEEVEQFRDKFRSISLAGKAGSGNLVKESHSLKI